MTPDNIAALFSNMMYITVLMLMVLIAPGLLVGLLVAMFQAATQINESSLSFIPKILVTFLTMLWAGPWLVKTLVNYTHNLIADIPWLVG